MPVQGSFAIQGMSMSAYYLTDFENPHFADILDNAVADGTNYVELSNESVIDVGTGTITDWMNGSVDNTAKFSDIGPAIALTESKGLNVMLKPQIAAYDPALAQFTGSNYGNLTDSNLTITNPAAFFAGYKAYILQWATLAQQYHVPILSIGNEMLAATKPQYTSYWNDIIDSVRHVYSGALTYSALIPLNTTYAPGNEAAQIQFWSKLDYAGIDVYPSLTTHIDPSVSTLNAAWQHNVIQGQPQSYVQFLNQLAAGIGKPVLFTETGVASFPGANDRFDNPDSKIAASGTTSDVSEQANWWESFFETWAVSRPAWLAGIFAWNNDPGTDLNSPYYTEGYDLYGKPADKVLSAWFGGKDYIDWSQDSLTGTPANDRIALYGSQIASPATALQSFKTTVSISMDGTIMGGHAPTVHFYINGIDEGAVTLTSTPGGYVDPHGVPYSATQTFKFSLPGLTSINQIKIAFDSAVSVGGPENSDVFIHSVSVNGVSLGSATYTPLPQYGSTQTQVIGTTSGQYGGGYTIVDAGAWNAALSTDNIGTSSDPIRIDGGAGLDTVIALGTFSQYKPTVDGATNTITLSETAGLHQNAVLTNVERVQFSDAVLAVDIQGDAGNAYRLYQAAFDRTPDTGGLSYWVHQLDGGMDFLAVAQSFVNSTEFKSIYGISPTHAQIVDSLYHNVLGRAGDPSGTAYWVGQLDTGTSVAVVLASFAQSAENHAHVDPTIVGGITLGSAAFLA